MQDKEREGRRIILLMGLAMLPVPLGIVPVANVAAAAVILALVIFTSRKVIRYFRGLGDRWKSYVTESRVISWLSLVTLILWLRIGHLEYQVYQDWLRDANAVALFKKYDGSGWFWLCYLWTAVFGTYLSFRAVEIRTVIRLVSAGISDATVRFDRSFLPWMAALAVVALFVLGFLIIAGIGALLALQMGR